MTERTMPKDRLFELAWGVRCPKDPHDMTREELEDTIYSVADYASRKLSEVASLKSVIRNAITENH